MAKIILLENMIFGGHVIRIRKRRSIHALLAFLVAVAFHYYSFLFVRAGLADEIDDRRLESMSIRNPNKESSRYGTRQYPIVDILSIGSKRRPDYLVAQQESFASHSSVRHFFNVSEADDLDDPDCDMHLTAEDVFGISRFCTEKYWNPKTQTLMRYLQRNSFASESWLKKKANPVGWMCAQRRPLHGLYKVFQNYFQKQATKTRTPIDDSILPDYLIVMDDDTYFNLEQFQQLIAEDVQVTRRPLDDPYVLPGCLVRTPIHVTNFTFGFGGFGTVFNKASLQRLVQPIRCSSGDKHSQDACAQVKRNEAGEERLFQDGMSVLELMHALVMDQPYKDFSQGKWTEGYCMHSDWVLGYFVNFYNISRHTSMNPYFKDVPQSRMEEWKKSSIYRSKEGFCKNERAENCKPESLTCHYMKPEDMRNYTDIVKLNAPPGRFHLPRVLKA